MSHHTTSSTAGHRLTERDRAALEHLATLRAVRLDDLGVLLPALAGRGYQPLGARTTRDVVARWQALGYAATQRYPGQGPAVVLPTAKTARLARVNRPRALTWTETPHTLTTAAVATRYLAQAGGTWWAESRLRVSLAPGEHLPDGLWQPPGEGAAAVAVEVERNGKAADRWASIATDLLSRHAHVHYWLSASTGPAWLRWSTANLTQADRARVTTYELESMQVAR